MQVKTIIILLAALALLLASCATKAAGAEAAESEIFGTENAALDGTEWIQARFFDKATKKPMASREFEILLVSDDDRAIGVIYGKSDENGWVCVKNVPAKHYLVTFYEERKMTYTGDVSYEEIYLPPTEHDDELLTEWRCYLRVSRSDGATRELDATTSATMGTQGKEAFEPKLAQTDSGFLLDFGKGGGRLFFREIYGEPCLYRAESAGKTARIISPPIPIGELSAKKIGELLDGEITQ